MLSRGYLQNLRGKNRWGIRDTGFALGSLLCTFCHPSGFFPLYKEEAGAFRIDPGMMELTPALAARIIGADLIIATTAYDALPFSEYNTPLRAFRKLIEFVKENNTKRLLKAIRILSSITMSGTILLTIFTWRKSLLPSATGKRKK